MDDQQVGIRIRAARIRRGWRQADLARAAGVSPSTVSRIERGHLDGVAVGLLRRVAAALEIRVDHLLRSRAGDLERLVSARHAALGEAVLARLTATGWSVRPEVSFNDYGERGVVDVVAWHPARTALLIIELKTEIVDVGELLAVLDRKERLGLRIARRLGWEPSSVSVWLVIGDSHTNRRRVIAHRTTFGAAFPADGRTMRRWLRDPAAPLRALSFWPNAQPGTGSPGYSAVRRVRRPAAPSS